MRMTKVDNYIKPVLKTINDYDNCPEKVREFLHDELISTMQISRSDQMSKSSCGFSHLENRIIWATLHLLKNKMICKKEDCFKITEIGKKMLAKNSSEKITIRDILKYK